VMSFLEEQDHMNDSEKDDHDLLFFNPLAQPLCKWYEFHKRVHLFPWWIRYNLGTAKEADLKNRIIEVGKNLGLSNIWMNKIIRHSISEFSKKGLGFDYYGYHNIYHELEATYFTLLAASGQNQDKKSDLKDIKYLFLSALFHDYDPSKHFDKPNEDEVEWFIRKDKKIRDWIEEEELNIDILMAMIHRTAYPFRDKIALNALERMNHLFSKAGIPIEDEKTRKYYHDLGWFLSVSERVAGYALGNFDRAIELARLNAHGLGWHPSLINQESVKYFSLLKGEKEMLERILNSVSEKYKQNFLENIAKFKEAWIQEVEIKRSLRKNEISLIPNMEDKNVKIDPAIVNSIIDIRNDLNGPLQVTNRQEFVESLSHPDTILITLRVKEKDRMVIGFAKGGPLEQYQLRRGTNDANYGKKNTVFIESIYIRPGYWGEKGGHILRLQFLTRSKKLGYEYVTGYVHRGVLLRRSNKGEPIQLVQKYDPDKLDYYRIELNRFNYDQFV